jgi:tetratricopeptide (TPR) repeat protein
MAVTLPFALLLLDYWPLHRIDGWTDVSPQFAVEQKSFRRLVLEKCPLFSLSLLSCAITVWAQKAGGALRPLQAFSFDVRLKNAVSSCVSYLWQTFWPSGFALYYPHPGSSVSSWKAVLAAVCLFAVTLILWNQRKTRAYLLVGWLWFVGTLVPVIGIVQVGDQAMADRYMYLPLLGIFVIAVWAGAELFHKYSIHWVIRFSTPALVLGTLSVVTVQQLRYWDNSVTLWSHTLQVTNGNLQVEKQLANALVRQGSTDEVLPHLMKITRQDPADVTTHLNLGSYYASRGEVSAAAEQFRTAITLTDRRGLNPYDRKLRSSAFLNLGFASVLSNDYPTALSCFRAANQSDGEIVDQMIDNMRQSLASGSLASSIKLSLLLRAKEKDVEAFAILQDALRSDPDSIASRDLLNYLNGIRQQ